MLEAATLSPEQILEGFAYYQGLPNNFFREVLGAEPETYQERMNDAIAQFDRVAISACHDVGKSWDLARIVLWFATCFPFCKVITTAPTGRQVEKILWSEIRSAHRRSKVPLGGRMLTTEWKITEEGDWFALGFSPSNEASQGEGQGTQSTFQGFHAPYLLVVFDEATGVKQALWTMAEGLLTSANVKFVCIGNPTSTQSEFFKCFSNRAWHKIKLSCFDSPNLKANGIHGRAELLEEIEYCRALDDDAFHARVKSYLVVKPWLLTLRWVIEKALDWGVDSALFLSKVLGEFPEEGENVAIPLRIVIDAQAREYAPQLHDRKTMGVDVARFGPDSTVVTRMHGWMHTTKNVYTKRDTTYIVGEILNMCAEDMPDTIVVDETGLGGGVVDLLTEIRNDQRNPKIRNDVEIRGVQFGAAVECSIHNCEHKDCEKAKYVNVKARMFDLLARDMRTRIQLMDEEVYQAELPSIQYAYDSKGRMEIESKDKFKKRTGRGSPDHADSLALANFGHYDELTVGSFSKGKADASANKPRSWAKKTKERW